MFVEMCIGVIAGLLTALLLYLQSSAKKRSMLSKIPGPNPLPIVGNALELETTGSAFYNQILEYCETYKSQAPIFKLMLGTKPMIVCLKPESAEVVLSSTKFITKSTDYRFLHPWLGTGLLTSTGKKWQTRRKLLTPTFHFKILVDFLCVFNEQADVLTSCLEEKCGQGSFDIFPFITYCALDIISETAMGKSINAQKGQGNADYVDAIYKISELVQVRQKAPWLWPDFIYNQLPSGKLFNKYLDILQGFTNRVIEERKAEFESHTEEAEITTEDVDNDAVYVGKSKPKLAFLDLLLHMSNEAGFTKEDIREEVDTFMFEGHDTTAAAANWAVHLIGANPDVQKRLHEEMDQLFGDSDRPVTMDDIRNMKYLECVIKETLRLFPSVPYFARQLEEDTEICGLQVPNGSSLIVLVASIHRNEQIFPDPERFDPERFTKENAAGRHPYAFVPFSAGLRNCIGQRFAMNEEKVMLSSILRNFNIVSTQKREELSPVGEIILRPEHGIHVKLTKRVK